MKRTRRLLSAFLAALMFLSLLPMGALAEEGPVAGEIIEAEEPVVDLELSLIHI